MTIFCLTSHKGGTVECATHTLPQMLQHCCDFIAACEKNETVSFKFVHGNAFLQVFVDGVNEYQIEEVRLGNG